MLRRQNVIEEFTNYMVLIISNFWKKCLKRALETNVQKRSPLILEHPVAFFIRLIHTKYHLGKLADKVYHLPQKQI